MILIVGATGTVGGMCTQQLAKRGPVRASVRSTSDQAKVEALKGAGAEIVTGDLKDKASIERAVKGVTTVITTASTTMSKQPSDTLDNVDRDGQLALVDAAKAAGVKQLIYVSFPQQDADSPLQQAKRAVEKHLATSGIGYTILRPTFFIEAWLSPALGFDLQNRKVRLLGSGEAKHPWIGVDDVCAYIVGSVDNAKVLNKVLDLGGPEALSQRDVVRLGESIGGKPFAIEELPEAALAQQLESGDAMGKAFAALMLSAARGVKLNLQPSLDALPLTKRATVQDYVKRALS